MPELNNVEIFHIKTGHLLSGRLPCELISQESQNKMESQVKKNTDKDNC